MEDGARKKDYLSFHAPFIVGEYLKKI